MGAESIAVKTMNPLTRLKRPQLPYGKEITGARFKGGNGIPAACEGLSYALRARPDEEPEPHAA